MEISRERFLDESRSYHLTIGIRSRTTEAHSLLSALTPDEREQVSAGDGKSDGSDRKNRSIPSHARDEVSPHGRRPRPCP